ncbi:hypothetical protein AB0A66_02355 [Streptomyces longwoodensis]|uniref:hypothetical protein n=1 Tax=Streptomyces longwoodensis TaxID=68231 RepID=UPI0033F86D8D
MLSGVVLAWTYDGTGGRMIRLGHWSFAWYLLIVIRAALRPLAYVGVERPAERRPRGPAPSARPAVGAGFEGRAQGDQD